MVAQVLVVPDPTYTMSCVAVTVITGQNHNVVTLDIWTGQMLVRHYSSAAEAY